MERNAGIVKSWPESREMEEKIAPLGQMTKADTGLAM